MKKVPARRHPLRSFVFLITKCEREQLCVVQVEAEHEWFPGEIRDIGFIAKCYNVAQVVSMDRCGSGPCSQLPEVHAK